MAFDDNVRDNDEVYASHDVKVIVDDQTLGYLKSATVDYTKSNGRAGFRIEPDSPATESACGGCGSSESCC